MDNNLNYLPYAVSSDFRAQRLKTTYLMPFHPISGLND